MRTVTLTHIPKTGGTSLRTLFMTTPLSFTARQGCYEDVQRAGAYNIVFARDPVSHVKSQFLECRDDVDWGQKVRSKTFPHTANESADYDAWLRHFSSLPSYHVGGAHDYNCEDPRNTMVRHLSCHSNPRNAPGDSGHPPNHALAQPLNITRAVANLNRASFVGLTGRLNESLCVIERDLGIRFGGAVPHITHHVRDSVLRLNGVSHTRLVQYLTRMDWNLYVDALALFEHALSRHPDCRKTT